MIKEYIVKITDDVIPDAFARFEEEYSPEQELIRCKECKRHLECDYWIENGDDWFCADGKRNEGR
jgi:hypothetical protein